MHAATAPTPMKDRIMSLPLSSGLVARAR
jgi:hypothetical protein